MNDNENVEYQVPNEFLEKELHLVSVLFCWKRITIPLRSFRVVKSIHSLTTKWKITCDSNWKFIQKFTKTPNLFEFASEF